MLFIQGVRSPPVLSSALSRVGRCHDYIFSSLYASVVHPPVGASFEEVFEFDPLIAKPRMYLHMGLLFHMVIPYLSL